jgi:CubicO group peptidase (beta-lactamase class C family)
MKTKLAFAMLLLGASVTNLLAQTSAPQEQTESLLPVSAAKAGFTPQQAAALRQWKGVSDAFAAGNISLYMFLNIGEMVPTAVVKRSGPVVPLESAISADLGKIKFKGENGELTLDDYIVKERTQGVIVLHGGKVVYEQYPGMRPEDNHVWMSVAKTMCSLIVEILAEEGKLDVSQSIGTYLTEFAATEWATIPVKDILDMASGMNVEENAENKSDPASIISRLFAAEFGFANAVGEKETMLDVLKSAKRSRASGEAFEYSSANTQMLVLLAEAVSGKLWIDLVQERVWSKMNVEGDLVVGVTPQGTAIGHGLLNTRLRDMARYGLLYTPSWSVASREQIISGAYAEKLRTGGRPETYTKGTLGARLVNAFAGDTPVFNTWQWDAIFADGDLYKEGVMGQGLYVSPNKDLVVAWFSTALESELTHYARLIARSFGK